MRVMTIASYGFNKVKFSSNSKTVNPINIPVTEDETFWAGVKNTYENAPAEDRTFFEHSGSWTQNRIGVEREKLGLNRLSELAREAGDSTFKISRNNYGWNLENNKGHYIPSVDEIRLNQIASGEFIAFRPDNPFRHVESSVDIINHLQIATPRAVKAVVAVLERHYELVKQGARRLIFL